MSGSPLSPKFHTVALQRSKSLHLRVDGAALHLQSIFTIYLNHGVYLYLQLDSLLFQLGIVAVDGGSPAFTSTATVQITVRRNLNSPDFSPSRYEITLPENQPLGEVVGMVTAVDSDLSEPHKVVRYSLEDEEGGVFMVDAETGELALKNSLLGQTAERIEVRR